MVKWDWLKSTGRCKTSFFGWVISVPRRENLLFDPFHYLSLFEPSRSFFVKLIFGDDWRFSNTYHLQSKTEIDTIAENRIEVRFFKGCFRTLTARAYFDLNLNCTVQRDKRGRSGPRSLRWTLVRKWSYAKCIITTSDKSPLTQNSLADRPLSAFVGRLLWFTAVHFHSSGWTPSDCPLWSKHTLFFTQLG